ncbi:MULTISPECIES: hypothetical protein [unclassified Mesorhizobium]|uniref:hypothetical protein n=1 Tax=unclassified Mesorhizobium TaxID=325217 RepID=UPI000BB06929|nr:MULTISPECIES: hypothetical protein [unclassified Mesorhizobium]PBB23656.1 hypothetical protein CK232_27395 [Mesorhizobium sp. WSM4304]PBB72500.1 hypothetical protein CK227_27095 [Mesorhizobium sp. WSM4308]PBC20291.1 hypothetical protein CK226_24680 [Mesorhizobium sp. WSM4311]TRD04660.1 hypothetical protein FJV82_12370 [Mesorhizobium sp. WSM4305]
MIPAPVIPEIVRQHAEMAAFLWIVYDDALLHPEENPEMDEVRIARLIERLEAHLDGLRVARADGLRIAKERYSEFPEAGELFVLRMLEPSATRTRVSDLDLAKVRAFLAAHVEKQEP